MDSTNTVAVSAENFEAEILVGSDSTPILVDFWAAWCEPCKSMAPLLEKLVADYAGRFRLAKINVDESPDLAAQFGVSGIPALFLVANRSLIGQATGGLPEPMLREFLEKHLPSEADLIVARALSFEAADPTGAQRMYEQALMLNPNHGPAKAQLAGLLLAGGNTNAARLLLADFQPHSPGWERAQQVISQIEFSNSAANSLSIDDLEIRLENEPENYSLAMELGTAYAALRNFPEALRVFLKIVEMNREFGFEHARPAMIKIFQLLGNDDPLTATFRPKLARLLY